MSSGVRALVLGASGETGKEVVKCLAESDQVTKIILVGRRKLEDTDNPKVRALTWIQAPNNLVVQDKVFAD